MPNCKYCGKPVTSGIVCHAECAGEMRWISVADTLPKESDFVLVADARTNEFAFACLRKDESGEMRWFWSNPDEGLNFSWDFEEFTHWMPLPEPPGEEVKHGTE